MKKGAKGDTLTLEAYDYQECGSHTLNRNRADYLRRVTVQAHQYYWALSHAKVAKMGYTLTSTR
jgi:hypothetical protein